MKKTSKFVGLTSGMFKCVGTVREDGTSFLICECMECGHKLMMVRSSWGNKKNCPECKGMYAKEKQTDNRDSRTNQGNYKRYRSIREYAEKNDGAIWHGWISWKLFDKWCKDNRITTKTHKMDIKADERNFGPYSVQFIPITEKAKNVPEIER